MGMNSHTVNYYINTVNTYSPSSKDSPGAIEYKTLMKDVEKKLNAEKTARLDAEAALN